MPPSTVRFGQYMKAEKEAVHAGLAASRVMNDRAKMEANMGAERVRGKILF